MNRLVAALGTVESRRLSLVHSRLAPAKPGSTGSWPEWPDPSVVAAYRTLGIDQPWRHQTDAFAAIGRGHHTVIATGTGSGKSLALWAPVLSDLADHGPLGMVSAVRHRPTALYLAPTKALAADQLAGLRRVLSAGNLRHVVGARADGDSSWEERDFAANNAAVVMTNPDFLHFSLLPKHQRWARLLRSLRYVIVDELHAYRGLSGAHVGMVLRRLRRLADHYGADPVFLFASATLGEPVASAARLAGLPSEQIRAVTQDTAATGARTQVVWKPMMQLDDGTWQRSSASQAAAQLAANLTEVGARTVIFVTSRFAAEAVAEAVRNLVSSNLRGRIATYRGGYLAVDRRALEAGLRDGSLLTVVATSALELGIDVTGLDAVITAGWPGSRVGLTQQAGRAGRAGADGLAIWVAGLDPLDSYLMDHPQALFDTPLEVSVFDPDNPYVLGPHLCAAAGELPLTSQDKALFGPTMPLLLEQLAVSGVIRQRPTGWHWVLPESPATLTDLRGAGGRPVELMESVTGRVLGTVDAGRAPATVHPGAVYLHQGESFVVEELDLVSGIAALRAARPPYTTMAISQTTVRIIEPLDVGHDQNATWRYGQVEVVSQVTGYERLSTSGQGRMGAFPLDLPAQPLTTTGTWLIPGQAVVSAVPRDLLPGALHAAEHAAIGLLPLFASCDRWDLGGLSTLEHRQTGSPTIFIHDALPGGAGLAKQAFEQRAKLLAAVRELLASCPCESGCPSCIQSPKCGNGNQILSKPGALLFLTALLADDASR